MRAGPETLLALVGALGVLACDGSDDASVRTATTNRLVVGVLSDLEPGVELARLRIVATANDAIVSERVLRIGASEPADELRIPYEIPFPDLAFGTRVHVRLEAYETLLSDEQPLVWREAATEIVSGVPKLLRVRLERECIPNYQLGGETVTPTCESPETCIAAACTDPWVQPDRLEDYRADWANDFADACKPEGAGEPEIEIGEGREAFRSLEGNDVMQLGAGFQGGYHVWVAIRMKNLHQSGSLTHVEGSVLDPPAEFDAMSVVYGYEPTGDGRCDVVGLRFEVPEEYWSDVTPLFGAPIQIRAKVVDVAGDAAFHETLAHVSETFVKDVTD